MSKFEVGDHVIVIGGHDPSLIGLKGMIVANSVGYDNKSKVFVHFDNDWAVLQVIHIRLKNSTKIRERLGVK